MSFTNKQNQAVHIRKNCTVTAGAGSGKTTVLSSRFEELVSVEHCDCDRILTITFTKKATAEMKQKIHSLLAARQDKRQLGLFSSAYISTFDSFLSEIARTDCRSYGLSGDFSVAQAADFEKDMQSLAKTFLVSKENRSITEKLLFFTSVESLASFLCQLESYFFDFANPLDWQKESAKALNLAKSLKTKKTTELSDLCKEYIDSFYSDDSLAANCEHLEEFLTTGDISKISFVPRVRGKKENQESAKEFKNNITAILEDVQILNSLDENLASDMYELAGRFEREVLKFKRQNGVLTFNNIMQLAIDILLKNTRIRTFYKNRFDYVMVDEFQDNNDSYRKLLYLLCEKKDKCSPSIPQPEDLEPEKLFLVGDEKQSIYKFRGADVSVFKKVSENLGEKISLDTNFRSTAKLVEHFNYVFKHVFDDAKSDYDADFEEVKARNDGKDDLPSKIIFNSFYCEDKGEEDDASLALSEAFSIAQLIDRMLNSDDFLIKKDGVKTRPQESDIAVLMRSTGWQINLERALRLKKIKYTLAETRAMTTEALVNDFYNVLQLCVYPYDSISQAAYLHSPFGGFKTYELTSENLKQKIEEDQDLKYLKAMLQDGELSRALLYIWYEMGYRTFIVSNPANQVYEEHFETLFSLSCEFEKQGKTVFDFLEYLRPLLGTTNKMMDLSVLSANTDGVQLMTIHKSKGLQFPIVIIASMRGSAKNDSAVLKAYKTNDTVVLPVCNLTNFAWFLNKKEEKNKDNAELKRLLYVACTRASQHLVYSSVVKPSDLQDKERDSETLLSLFLKAYNYQTIDQQLETMTFSRIKTEETFSYQRLTESDLEKAKSFYKDCIEQNYDYDKQIKAVTDNEGHDEENQKNNFEKLPALDVDPYIVQNDLNTDFGTLCHKAIENKIKQINESIEGDGILVKAAELLSDRFLNSAAYKMIEFMDKKAEQGFYYEQNGQLLHGVIDLLCEDEEKIIIYDYKTDVFKNPEMHRCQLQTYVNAVSSLNTGKEVSAYLVYLRDPDNPVKIIGTNK